MVKRSLAEHNRQMEAMVSRLAEEEQADARAAVPGLVELMWGTSWGSRWKSDWPKPGVGEGDYYVKPSQARGGGYILSWKARRVAVSAPIARFRTKRSALAARDRLEAQRKHGQLPEVRPLEWKNNPEKGPLEAGYTELGLVSIAPTRTGKPVTYRVYRRPVAPESTKAGVVQNLALYGPRDSVWFVVDWGPGFRPTSVGVGGPHSGKWGRPPSIRPLPGLTRAHIAGFAEGQNPGRRQQSKGRVKPNPPLLVFTGNPPKGWTVMGSEVVEIRYRHADDKKLYRHTFRHRPKMLASPDGKAVAIVARPGTGRMWEEY